MFLYKYSPLDSSKKEIRIVRFPGTIDADECSVSCTIQHVSLDQKPWMHEQCSRMNAAVSCLHTARPIEIEDWRDDGGLTTFSGHGPTHSGRTIKMVPRYAWGDFEAVSYCWESDVRNKTILVDGCIVWVPTNLEAMLRELRKLPEAVSGAAFWIDGLCINQTDILEKNQQVGMMQQIYFEALSVVVWLGPSVQGTGEAVEILRTLRRAASGSTLTVSQGDNIFQNVHANSFSGFQWMSVLGLWSRNYFKRMWIIQELAANKRLSMIICGDHRFTRNDLRKGTDWAKEHASAISRRILEDVHPHSLPEEVDHDLIWRLGDHVVNLIRLGDTPSTDHIFNLSRRSQATDPRDKIYGMLGLCDKEITASIEPDYSKSVEQVYEDFAVCILRSCYRLDELLSWCIFVEGSALPSWVPDWRIGHQRNHLQWLRAREAGGDGYKPIWSLEEGKKVLRVKGVKVDQVESTSGSTSNSLPYRAVGQRSAVSLQEERTFGRYCNMPLLKASLELTLLQDHPHRFEPGNLTDIPWVRWDRAPVDPELKHLLELVPGVTDQWKIFDRFRQSNATFNIFGHAFKDFFPHSDVYKDDLVDTAIDPTSIDEFRMEYGMPRAEALPMRVGDIKHGWNTHYASNLRRAAVALQNRCLFTTHTGFLGLAPEESRAGDILAVLLGCNHPVILRPQGDRFLYIGECFVHGIMDGEVIAHAERDGRRLEDELEDIPIA